MVKEYGMLLEKKISVDDSKSLSYKLKNKKYTDEKILFDFLNEENVECNYPLYKKNGKLALKYNTYVEDIKKARNSPSINIKFDNAFLDKYRQFILKMKFNCDGFVSFYVHFSFYSNGKEYTHTQSVAANSLEDIIWELKKEDLSSVTKFNILIFVMGTPSEASKEVEVVFDSLVARSVKCEYDKGWDLEDRIAYSHIGYLVNKKKTALTSKCALNVTAKLYDVNNKCVYECLVSTLDDKYNLIDFSSFNQKGKYKLATSNGIETEYFDILDNIYDEAIIKTMNFLKSLRCGEVVDGVHSACHLYSKSVHPVTKESVPNFGGWHDAGDLSQFEICTAEMTSGLCDLALALDEGDLKERVIDEAYVGCSWLLRTRFGDGYRALSVLYRTWHSNVVLEDDKSIYINEAEEGPFENFIASEALAKMAMIARSDEYKAYCLKAAKEDFSFGVYEYNNGIYTKRWGKSMDSQTIGALLSAGSALYKVTKDKYYLDVMKDFYKKVLATQEVNTELDLYGYFYEDKEHNYILAYEHRGHDQSPICGLISYYEVCDDSLVKKELEYAISLYSDFIKKSFNMNINRFNMLPQGVYNENKINIEHYTTYGYDKEKAIEVLKGQVKTGKKLNDNSYLRSFPISLSRRGFHATLLSKVKGVSSLAKVFNDEELEQIAISQIEWILGYNPFSTSTMYGLGYNYHPLYVAFSKQMVGSLPVGFMTYKDNDSPYWPVRNNAVYKEIWGHTSGKFIWVLADILEMEKKYGK